MAKPRALWKKANELAETCDVAALTALMANQAGVAALDEVDALARIAQSGDAYGDPVVPLETRLAAVELLVNTGIDLDQTGPAYPTPFACVVAARWIEPEKKHLELVRTMLAKGADPNLASGSHVLHRDRSSYNRAKLRGLLAPHATQTSWLQSLELAIEDTGGTNDIEKRGHVDALLARVDDTAAIVRGGLAPLHVAAMAGTPELLERALAGSRRPSVVTTSAGRQTTRCPLSNGSFTAVVISYQAGATAADLVVKAQEKLRAPVDSTFEAESRAARVILLDRSREMLVSAGLPPPAPRTRPLPSWKATIDALFVRLCALAGTPTHDLAPALDRIDLEDLGPWTYFLGALATAPELLCSNRMQQIVLGTQLARFIAGKPWGEHDRPTIGDGPYNPIFGLVVVHPSDYPEAAHVGLARKLFIGADGPSRILFLWPTQRIPNPARVCMVTYDSFHVLAETVEDFLRMEVELAEAGDARLRSNRL